MLIVNLSAKISILSDIRNIFGIFFTFRPLSGAHGAH